MLRINGLFSRLSRPFQRRRDDLIYDTIALEHLRPLMNRFDYLAWPRPSMRPGGVLFIVNDILINNRKRVFEFGAGISTLLSAAALEKTNGSLVSIEEDNDWLDLIRDKLTEAGLIQRATLVHAKRESMSLEGQQMNWYSQGPVEEAARTDKIDALIVDGPAAYKPNDAEIRFPALPLLEPMLSDDCVVILDDAGRSGEASIMGKWSSLLRSKPEDLQLQAGIYAWSRGKRFYPGL